MNPLDTIPKAELIAHKMRAAWPRKGSVALMDSGDESIGRKIETSRAILSIKPLEDLAAFKETPF